MRDTFKCICHDDFSERIFDCIRGYVEQDKSLGTVVFWAFILIKGGEKSDKQI